jgi:hAT family C-terminal dimerisation region
MKVVFPLARAVHCVPATSAPSESLFSVAGFILSKRRSCLSIDHLRTSTMVLRNIHLFQTTKDFAVVVAREMGAMDDAAD